MRASLLLGLLLLFFASCTDLHIEELNYGVAKSEVIATTQGNPTPTGDLHRGESILTIINHTDSIPAKAGVQFGMEYKVLASESRKIKVDITWEYPEGMKDKEGKPLRSSVIHTQEYTNKYSHTSYLLEQPNELVKGDWILKIGIDGKVMHTRTFHLY